MSALNALLWMAAYFFIPVTALAWCIDILERRLKRDETDKSEDDKGPGLRRL
ncbi:hypothetical protein PBI_MYXUS_64 [Mycobacterium phage Myxus]|uniref:Uncharacterized protein n=6 Tax=Fromanvirus packman TaxID=1034142 RepID=G1BR69_9CAUD|nr:hypothetical protein AVV05_gp044 [Mycobacterium phage Pioneer]YP_009301888.1 hypothetical protein BJD80_gp045 [Mycobacterium phage Catalina]YP_009636033.1 hypothetical protein FGG56_gp40 [Mycobacterium phage PackMan]AMO43932.1 hypothetical protein PBI_MYXUS_64 [Mycobacterium phage Myxus]AOQ29021.1 hypothetical protein SEA_HORTUMSL17_65 [Mycobacterium phage HortumSL17]AOY12048.1 hypothetical protein SEA_PHAEDER_64 [Mycobacterium phage Phaeder]AVI04245.1 hypothetical protein SEA_PHONNEGUT_65